MTTCPTPNKKRYATREGAESGAHRSQIAIDAPLYPYHCLHGCGWWHLSKKHDTIPAGTTPDPAVVEQLANLGDVEFRAIVSDDARGTASLPNRVALRQPALVARWHTALGALIHDVDQQLVMRRDEKKTDWGRRALATKNNLQQRRKESHTLCEAEEARIRAERKQQAIERRQPAPKTPAELRAEAGDAAIKRLIDAHGLEFARYLAEECERIGTLLPDRIARRLADAA